MLRSIPCWLLLTCLTCLVRHATADDLQDLQGTWVGVAAGQNRPVVLEIRDSTLHVRWVRFEAPLAIVNLPPVTFQLNATISSPALSKAKDQDELREFKEFEFDPIGWSEVAKGLYGPLPPQWDKLLRQKGLYRLRKNELYIILDPYVMGEKQKTELTIGFAFHKLSPEAVAEFKRFGGYWQGGIGYDGHGWLNGVFVVMPGWMAGVVQAPPRERSQPDANLFICAALEMNPKTTPSTVKVPYYGIALLDPNERHPFQSHELTGIYELEEQRLRSGLFLGKKAEISTIDEALKAPKCVPVEWKRIDLVAAQEWLAQRAIQPPDFVFQGEELQAAKFSAASLPGRWIMKVRRDLIPVEEVHLYKVVEKAPKETWEFNAKTVKITVAGSKSVEYGYRLHRAKDERHDDEDQLIFFSPKSPQVPLRTFGIRRHLKQLEVWGYPDYGFTWPNGSKESRVYELKRARPGHW